MRREGLRAKQLHWWSWKLGTSDAAPQPAEPRFLPVRVVSSPAPAPSSPEALVMTSPPGSAAMAIEIALPNGGLVRVPPGFDPATARPRCVDGPERVAFLPGSVSSSSNCGCGQPS